MSAKIDRRIEDAICRIIARDVAYASILLGVDIIHDARIDTAATDGLKIMWNPQYLDEIKSESSDDGEAREKVMGVNVHEAEHIMRLHPWRRHDRDMELWNRACDYVINWSMTHQKDPYILPKGALIDARFATMSEEQVYAVLEKETPPPQKQNKPGQGNGKTGSGKSGQQPGNQPGNQPGKGKPSSGKAPGSRSNIGEVMDCPGTEAEREEAKQKAIVEVIRAAETAKQMGNCPGWLESYVEATIHPVIPWQDELRDYLLAKARDIMSWARPNPRMLDQGFYLPTKFNFRCGTVAVVFDTSGSIGQAEVNEFAGELSSILEHMKPERVVFIQCDAAIHDFQVWEDETEIPGGRIKIRGGGGTSFRPPFKRLEEENITPDVLIYFTDGYGTFPDEVEFPVIWAITTEQKVPFGTRLQMNLKP